MDNTFIFFRFLADKKTFFLELSNTNRDFLEEIPSASKTFKMDFLRAISLTFLTVGIFWNFTGAIFLSKISSVPSNLLIILIIGSFLGGYFGAHLSKLKGNIVIKKCFTTVCLLVGVSLLIKSIKTFYIN